MRGNLAERHDENSDLRRRAQTRNAHAALPAVQETAQTSLAGADRLLANGV